MDQNEIAAYVDEQRKRTMAVFALRRIREMIDQEAADELEKRQFSVYAVLVIAAAALVAIPVVMLCTWVFRTYL